MLYFALYEIERKCEMMKWFKIWGERWFMGSTRWELTIEQRAVFVDLLARASINKPRGQIDYYSLEQLAQQFNVSIGLLESTIERCVEVKKIKCYPKKRKILIVNWVNYQSEYERQKPYRKQDRCQLKVTKMDAKSCDKVTLRKEGEEKRIEIEEKENNEDEKREKSITPNNNSSISPLLSISKPFSKSEITKKDQFLSMLRDCNGYPFDEFQDSLLFDVSIKDYPDINIIKQTAKKIAWWKEHPEALKADPRKKLQDWFKEEFKFQKRGGPQKLGEIMREVDDPDHRKFLGRLLQSNPKNKGDEPF